MLTRTAAFAALLMLSLGGAQAQDAMKDQMSSDSMKKHDCMTGTETEKMAGKCDDMAKDKMAADGMAKDSMAKDGMESDKMGSDAMKPDAMGSDAMKTTN